MSNPNNLEQSKILDSLDFNKKGNDLGKKNDYFVKGSGGPPRNYNFNNNGYGNNNNRGRGYNNYPRNQNRNYNNYNTGGRRQFDGNGRNIYGNKEIFNKRIYENNDIFGEGNNVRNKEYNRYYNKNNKRITEVNDIENNFNRPQNNMEENPEYQMQKEAMYEKEKSLNDFKKKYREIIEAIKVLFINEQLEEKEIIEIIKNIISNPTLTIFEALNLIEREVKIIKTLQFVKSEQKRQYGPNKDILEPEFEPYFPKNNLRKVIQKYKVYEKDDSETFPDEQWFFIGDFDRRRRLTKDEMGYFNYLPLLCQNPNDKNDKEYSIYAKNDNEVLYHYLFYKTLMCKYCDLSNEFGQGNELCPYAHNILTDFRIIYDYKNEEISKFMLLLLKSKLFHFENYLNHIPMSLSPNFNIETFKIHKCQLDDKEIDKEDDIDDNCPNDYHLCPYYHKSIDGDDQRRPPLLFGYLGNPGDLCFDEKKKKYCPKKCKCGIFCHYLHNKNEYNYHRDHFGKEYECKRKKIKGKCIYYKTCYGIHSTDSDNEKSNEEEEEEEEDEEKTQKEIENDENIKEEKKKIK